jgi:hypothetical protein
MANPVQPVTAQGGYAITKSDSTVYVNKFSALWVGTGGDVTIRTIRGETVTYEDVPSGTVLPVAGDMVMSTGTAASGITGMTY